MPQLLIRVLEQAADSPLQWYVLDENKQTRSSGNGRILALKQLLMGEGSWLENPSNVIVMLPAESFLFLNCSVPGRSSGQIRKALPFVVEEYLASDIDRVHIAHGPIQRGKKVPCLAIDKSLLEDWRHRFEEIGLKVGSMFPETLLLKRESGHIVLLFEETRALLASEDHLLGVEKELLPMALTSLLQTRSGDESEPVQIAQDETYETLEIELINGDLSAIQKSELESLTTRQIEWHNTVLEESTSEWLLRHWQQSPPSWNLLQGSYAPPKSRNEGWDRWRTAATLLLGWLVLLLGAEAAKGFWADYRADQLSEESVALYRDYFPQDQKVSANTVKRLMQAHLGQAGIEGQGFLAILGQVAPILKAQGATLRSLNYNDVREELSAEVSVPGFQNLDTLEQALKQAGLGVEISSAEQQQDLVSARLRLKGAL